MGDQGVERQLARLGDLGGAEAGLGVHDVVGVGLEVGAQYREVAGELGHRREQRPHRGAGERSGDLGVVGGDVGGVGWLAHGLIMARPPTVGVGAVRQSADTM